MESVNEKPTPAMPVEPAPKFRPDKALCDRYRDLVMELRACSDPSERAELLHYKGLCVAELFHQARNQGTRERNHDARRATKLFLESVANEFNSRR